MLWLGGMSGVGKTTGGRTIARRFDLRFYSLDSYTLDHHRNRVDPLEQPALHSFGSLSLEELWVETTGEEIADRFEAASRERFRFVLDDLLALPSDAPVIVDGPQLLPDLVAPILAAKDQALYLVADSALQQRLVAARGRASYERSSDPDRAFANRIERDKILAVRLRAAAAEHGLTVREVRDPAEAPLLIEAQFRRLLEGWNARPDRGDVSARRRDENDARLNQLRLWSDETPQAAEREVSFACECDRPGCAETVPLRLAEAQERRQAGERFVAHD